MPSQRTEISIRHDNGNEETLKPAKRAESFYKMCDFHWFAHDFVPCILGVAFLKLENETKRVTLPSSLISLASVHVMFVEAFKPRISMETFETSQSVVYIKDRASSVFYELDDIG